MEIINLTLHKQLSILYILNALPHHIQELQTFKNVPVFGPPRILCFQPGLYLECSGWGV